MTTTYPQMGVVRVRDQFLNWGPIDIFGTIEAMNFKLRVQCTQITPEGDTFMVT